MLCAVVILGQNVEAFTGSGGVDLLAAATAYIGLPLFLGLWLVHRLVTGTASRMVRYEEADLSRTLD